MFFEGDRVTGVIDFYFACNDLLAYDLAICLNAWCFEQDHVLQHHQGQGTAATAIAATGRSCREEIAALPILARGSALRFLMTRLYDWLHQVEGALVRPKDPREYLAKLRFHRARQRAGCLWPRLSWWRSTPTGRAAAIPARVAGPRSCAGASTSASWPAASATPPTTAWS